MTTPETTHTKYLCIYHANCLDGFTAAWVVHSALGGDDAVDFVPASYGDAPPDVTGRDVIIVDFSYKQPVLADMAADANSIYVLDHHQTAEQELSGYLVDPTAPIGTLMALREPQERPVGVFDMTRSGAHLAWNHFFPEQADNYPRIVRHVGDRDLWKFKYPETRNICALLAAVPRTFQVWYAHHNDLERPDGFKRVQLNGACIEMAHRGKVQQLLDTGVRHMMICGYIVPVCNAPFFMASDLAGAMAKQAVFAATYMDTPEGRQFSLRSGEHGADVSEIAKVYGGGGHKGAAGFMRPHGWEGEQSLQAVGTEPPNKPFLAALRFVRAGHTGQFFLCEAMLDAQSESGEWIFPISDAEDVQRLGWLPLPDVMDREHNRRPQ